MTDHVASARQDSGGPLAMTDRSSSTGGAPEAAAQRPADALDSPDFDAVKFLNDMFPTGPHPSRGKL